MRRAVRRVRRARFCVCRCRRSGCSGIFGAAASNSKALGGLLREGQRRWELGRKS